MPILLYCLYVGGAGLGPAIHARRREIQRAMDELCPGHKLESFDFRKASRDDAGLKTRGRRVLTSDLWP